MKAKFDQIVFDAIANAATRLALSFGHVLESEFGFTPEMINRAIEHAVKGATHDADLSDRVERAVRDPGRSRRRRSDGAEGVDAVHTTVSPRVDKSD